MGCWIELGSRKNEHDARIKTDTSAANNPSLSLRLNLYLFLLSLLSLTVPVSQAAVCNEGSCFEFMVGSDPCKILRVTKLPRPGPRREIFEHAAGSPACSRTASSRQNLIIGAGYGVRSNPSMASPSRLIPRRLSAVHRLYQAPPRDTVISREDISEREVDRDVHY